VAFGVRGALGGALLGLAVPNRHGVRVLSVVGFLGFAAGGALGLAILAAGGVHLAGLGLLMVDVIWLTSTAAVGGAVLGAGVGILARAWRPS
jgi:hypothetical protein